MIKASFINKNVERFNTATVVTLNVKITNNIDTNLVPAKLWDWIETNPAFKKYALYSDESFVDITCKTKEKAIVNPILDKTLTATQSLEFLYTPQKLTAKYILKNKSEPPYKPTNRVFVSISFLNFFILDFSN